MALERLAMSFSTLVGFSLWSVWQRYCGNPTQLEDAHRFTGIHWNEVFDQRSGPRQVAPDNSNAHTPTMTLKNAALLALIGTILATVLLVWTFVFNFVNVLRGLAPPVMLFSWFIYAFASSSVAVFFYVFHRAQSWLWQVSYWQSPDFGLF
jgi:hypothetical protein